MDFFHLIRSRDAQIREQPHPSTTTFAKEDEFRRLVDGVLFSRSFIATYQGAVIAVVLIAALYRWHQRSRRQRRIRRRRRENRETTDITRESQPAVDSSTASYTQDSSIESIGPDHSGTTSALRPSSSSLRSALASVSSLSSSSTLEDNTTPSQQPAKVEATEATPLLDLRRDGAASTRRRAFRPLCWMRSLLMYQPPPLPLLHRNVPDVYTTLVILSLLALNLFYLFFHLDFSRPVAVSILADRAGLLFVANLPWLYVLAAKNQPLKGLTGDSYETLNIFHRRLGEWMCWLAGVHFVGMMGAWYFALRPAGWGLWRFLTIPDVMLGVGAWMAYEGLYLTSLSSFRERCYEAFLASHVFLQAAALVLLWLHHPRSRPYVGVSLAIFSMDRLVWRLGIKSTTTTVDLRVMRDGETVLVSGNWPLPSRGKTLWRRIWGQNMSHGFQPSQHVFITVPAISKGHKFQAHPMTIASAAPGETNHAWFNLIIRAKAGFSRDLLDFAQTHDHTRVHLDGPYGSLHALEMLRSRDRAVIVAGGSGITVAYPMLWDLLRRTGGRQQVCLVWIVQDTSHVSWLGIERLQELRDSGCVVIIPPPSRTHGRPDVTGLLEDAIDSLVGRGDDDVGVVVSGPDGLNRNVNNACASMVGRGRIVECAIEKFGW